jgi:hypothetical protein
VDLKTVEASKDGISTVTSEERADGSHIKAVSIDESYCVEQHDVFVPGIDEVVGGGASSGVLRGEGVLGDAEGDENNESY